MQSPNYDKGMPRGNFAIILSLYGVLLVCANLQASILKVFYLMMKARHLRRIIRPKRREISTCLSSVLYF